jgi:hypothetical protein
VTPEERCRQIEKMLSVRRLELRGATPGEQAAATGALDRLLAAFGAADSALARRELDDLQARLDRAGRGARLTPRPPQPQPVWVQVVFTRSWSGTSTASTASTDWGWW